MTNQLASLIAGGLSRKPARTVFLVLCIVGTLVSFMTTEAASRNLAASAMEMWNAMPYDLEITGPGAFLAGQRVKGQLGVRAVENSYRMTADVNGYSSRIVALGDGSVLGMRYESGREPRTDDEIAVGPFVASRDRLEVGSEVSLSRTDDETTMTAYTVSGIQISWSSWCMVTEEGLRRLEPSIERLQSVLVTRDSSIDLADTKARVAGIVKEYEGLTLGDPGGSQFVVDSTVYSISAGISWLVLVSGMSSFVILLSLHQRDRSYELGVLRALGYNKISVFLVLSLDALVLIVVGLLLGIIGCVAATLAFRLGNVSTLLARNGGPAVKVALASALLAALVSLRTSNAVVTRLLSGVER